jgi:hypothetical protein
MAQDRRGNEVAKDLRNVLDVTKMGDGFNVTKMENVKNSTKNGHLTEVR